MVLGERGSLLSFPQDRRGRRGRERAGDGNGGQRALGERGLLGTGPGPGGRAASAVLARAPGARAAPSRGGRSKPVVAMATSLPGYLEGMSPRRTEQRAAEARCERPALGLEGGEAGRRGASDRAPWLESIGGPGARPAQTRAGWGGHLQAPRLRLGVCFNVAAGPPAGAALGTNSDS